MRISCTPATDQALIAFLPKANFTADELLRLEQTLQRQNFLADLREGIRGERVFGLHAFENTSMFLDSVETVVQKEYPDLNTKDRMRQFFATRDSIRDKEIFNQYMDRFIAATKQPPHQAYAEERKYNEEIV